MSCRYKNSISTKFNEIRFLIQFENNYANEPYTDTEKYILKSMWIMMTAEFEASIKEAVEEYIDKVKTQSIFKIHPCILLVNDFEKIQLSKNPIERLAQIYEKSDECDAVNNITYKKFTRDERPKYKEKEIISLFNSLGIFISKEDKLFLNVLDSIEKTRDKIAHGNQVEITARNLRDKLTELEDIFSMLGGYLGKLTSLPR